MRHEELRREIAPAKNRQQVSQQDLLILNASSEQNHHHIGYDQLTLIAGPITNLKNKN